MPAVIEFGFNAAPVFSGVARMDSQLQALDAKQQRRSQMMAVNGRMQLALLEAQISGNKKEAASIQNRISLLERMRQIQQQTNVSQREAYALAQRSSGLASMGGRGGRGFQTANVSYQIQDIAVQMQAGQRASIILAQQGSQLLSVFGAGGAIAGGVVAIGGAFYILGEKAREAFKEAQAAQAEFETKGRDAIANGSVAALIQFADTASSRVRDLEQQLDEVWAKRSVLDVLSEVAGGPSMDAKYAQQSDQLEKSRALQEQMTQALLTSSEREKTIAIARAEGRDRDADAMERNIKLAQEWTRISKLDLPADVKSRLENNATDKLFAEQQKADQEAAKEKQQQIDKIASAQERLDEQKRAAALDDMTLAKRIATMRVEAQEALEQENRLRSDAKADVLTVIDAEARRVRLQQDLNQLQRQHATEKERAADATKREAEAAARQAESSAKDAQGRRNTVLDTELEYKLLVAKAGGRKKEAEEIERTAKIIQRARSLEQNNGLDPTAAMTLATKMANLEDRANGKQGKIYTKPKIDNDPEGRFGLWGKPSKALYDSKPLYNSKPLTKNGGLAGFWGLQYGQVGSSKEMSQHALNNAFSTSSSLQAFHSANASKQDHTPTGAAGVVTEIQKLIQVTVQGFWGR